MTREEAIAQLKMDRDLANFNPMTGEEEPMNEDCRKSVEALDIAIKALEQEPKTGHWIEYSWNDNGLARWGLECDQCHKKYKYGGEIWNNPNYCPNCGAKMIESQESEE